MNQANHRAAALDRLVKDLGLLVAKHWLRQHRQQSVGDLNSPATNPAEVTEEKASAQKQQNT